MWRKKEVLRIDMVGTLDDELLAAVLHAAYRPVPWPWSEAGAVCHRWLALCAGRRVRGWYLAHSTVPRA